MVENVKISVVMCVYNHEDYIATAIDSVVKQKCIVPYEMLIGDDCSTDKTRQIIHEYALKYPKIIKLVYPEKNLGSSLNLINLIRNAQGEIISVCDGDDFWLRDDVLQIQWDTFKNNDDVGMFCAKAKCFIHKQQRFEGTLGSAVTESLMQMLLKNEDVAAPTIAFRKNLLLQCIDDCKWYIEQNCFYDSIMSYWFAYHSKIKFIDEEIAAYRVLENSACHATDYKTRIKYKRRYFSVKWRFVMMHPSLCSPEIFDILMNDFDNHSSEMEYIASLEMRNTRAYKIGKSLLKPLKLILKK